MALYCPLWSQTGNSPARKASAAWSSIVKFRVFMLTALIVLLISAQLIRVIPNALFLGQLGDGRGFSLLQLSGSNSLKKKSRISHAAVGALAGFVGGLSAVWGPPTVAYLTVMDVEKKEHIRTQGVIYGITGRWPDIQPFINRDIEFEHPIYSDLGAGCHTWHAFCRMIQDRIDQSVFMKATLLVLMIAGVNLIRRAFFA